MKWLGEWHEATFVKRYKRFLADVRLADGRLVTAHCANTGSMKTCLGPEVPCWLTYHDNPKRKLKYSLQALRLADGWVGVNTGLANSLVKEAIENERIRELSGYSQLETEKKYGSHSRIDLLLRKPNRPDCYVEVKNVTLLLEPKVAGFPDAVTERGLKHLQELIAVKASGRRAVLFFCVQREGIHTVKPADQYDPKYASMLREAWAKGVEILAYQATFHSSGILLKQALSVQL